MSFIRHAFLFLCLSTSGVLLSNVSDAFVKAHLSSDTNTKPPEKLLLVMYGDNDAVTLGNELYVPQVINPPKVTFDGNPDSYYTLIMIGDVDEIVLPAQFLHWMVSNIKDCDVNSGDESSIYFPPSTPPDKPYYYKFLLYEHRHKLTFDLEDFLTTNVLRPLFYIDKFVKKMKLGVPKFGNYFIGV